MRNCECQRKIMKNERLRLCRPRFEVSVKQCAWVMLAAGAGNSIWSYEFGWLIKGKHNTSHVGIID